MIQATIKIEEFENGVLAFEYRPDREKSVNSTEAEKEIAELLMTAIGIVTSLLSVGAKETQVLAGQVSDELAKAMREKAIKRK